MARDLRWTLDFGPELDLDLSLDLVGDLNGAEAGYAGLIWVLPAQPAWNEMR